MSNTVAIRSDRGIHPVDRRQAKKMAGRILHAVGVQDAELSLYFCSLRTIQGLNSEWRGKDRPTDVLSFPQDDNPDPSCISGPLGDIVISTDIAASQAEREGVSYEHEILRLLIHGVLHLLGYDHERGKTDAARMRREEKRIFKLMEDQSAGIVTPEKQN